MRTTPKLFAIATLLSVGLGVPAGAQSTNSTNRWLPRIGDIFSSKKTNEADKKSKAPAPTPTQKSPAKSEKPPTITINRIAPPTDATLVTVEEKSTRLMEILVELALLADPATFPYLLEARVEGQTLKIQGTVSSKSVRDHALKIVRVNCPLTVVDGMKEHPGSAPKKVASTDARNLENSAASALKQAFAKEPSILEVKCGTDGKAEVSGFVRSFEDKLRVSQALRRLHGCTYVHNMVHVLAEEGTASGPKTAPPRVVTPASAVPTPVFRKAPTGKAPQPLPIDPSDDPSLPAVPKVSAVDPADIDLLPILDRMSEQPVKMSKSIKDFPVATTAKNAKPATEKASSRPTTTAKAQPKIDPGLKQASAKAVKGNVVPAKGINEPSNASVPPAKSSDNKPAHFSTAAPSVPVITPTTATPIPFPVPSPPTSQERTLPPAPAPAKAADGTPQMLPGVAASLPSRLKTIVETGCGPNLKEVHVEVVSPTDIIVQFKVNNEAEGRQVARRVLALPELQRYRVEVRVKVPQ